MHPDLFADYVPEILVYDEKVDGSYEHQIRDEHLSTKEKLLEKVRKAKAKAKGNQTTFRQPIRTENEEK
jgi:Cu/Ag efflux pump CusA